MNYLVRVDNVIVPIEGLVSVSVGVVATSDLVADATATAGGTGTLVQASNIAGVRCELCVHGIGLPDVHLVTAGAVIVDVSYAIDPGRLRALSVAVASTIGRASRVEG